MNYTKENKWGDVIRAHLFIMLAVFLTPSAPSVLPTYCCCTDKHSSAHPHTHTDGFYTCRSVLSAGRISWAAPGQHLGSTCSSFHIQSESLQDRRCWKLQGVRRLHTFNVVDSVEGNKALCKTWWRLLARVRKLDSCLHLSNTHQVFGSLLVWSSWDTDVCRQERSIGLWAQC